MKQVFSILAVILCHLLSAQNIEWRAFDLDSLTNRIDFNVDLDTGGEDITNHLLFKIINGGVLDREILTDISSSIQNTSTAGLYNDTRIRFLADPKSVKLKHNNSLFLEFGNVIHADTEFQGDLFHLGFLGNADRLGETLALGNSSLKSMIFQYAGLGVMREKTQCYLSVNLVNIQSYFSAVLDNTTLYTGELAETLTLNYQGEITNSDSLTGNFISNSGLGFSVNGRWNIPMAEDQNLLSLEVRNLGLAFLNRPTTVTSADSTITFSGFSINELIADVDLISGISLSDSISVSETNGRQLVTLPTTFNVKYLHKINKSDYIQCSLRKYFLKSHIGELGLDYLHKESELISYAIGLSYGGFNKGARIRLGANLKHKNWSVNLHSTHAVGFFLEEAKGMNVSIGVQRKLYTAP